MLKLGTNIINLTKESSIGLGRSVEAGEVYPEIAALAVAIGKLVIVLVVVIERNVGFEKLAHMTLPEEVGAARAVDEKEVFGHVIPIRLALCNKLQTTPQK